MTSLFLSSSSSMVIPVLLLLSLLAVDIRSVNGSSYQRFDTQHQAAFLLLQSTPTRVSQSKKIISSRVITPTSTVSNKDDTATQLYAGSGFGSKSSSSSSSSKSPTTKSNKPKELFELQELSAQLETIKKQNILLQNLSKEKSEELSNYVKAVVDKTDSPIDVKTSFGTAQFVAKVENKSWRMIFSTDSSSTDKSKGDVAPGELPYGSTVILRIGEFMGTDGSLDYVLKFSKRVLGLNELVAKSSCSVDIGPVNPGVFTFTYEDIKTNIFGVSNLPVGFFGLLKGRVNYIDTVWFDGERWIERNYRENGDVIYSVYVRDTEDEKEYKK